MVTYFAKAGLIALAVAGTIAVAGAGVVWIALVIRKSGRRKDLEQEEKDLERNEDHELN